MLDSTVQNDTANQTQEMTPAMPGVTATYSPEDNKLRISSASRFSTEIYNRLKESGFRWAPKQQVFVAPMWTPEREDLALELAGEVDDEDSTLMERAEERSERFDGYHDRRVQDANQSYNGARAIAANIPMGQPILIGHHSEKRARRDAEKIENGMRRFAKLWETAAYWERRAGAAIAHAKYKESPAVRHRRIRTLEASQRKFAKSVESSDRLARDFAPVVATNESVLAFLQAHPFSLSPLEGNFVRRPMADLLNAGELTAADAHSRIQQSIERSSLRRNRWNDHYKNRIAYERAMLGQQTGATVCAEKFPDLAVGCRVLVNDWSLRGAEAWHLVSKLNRGAGDEIVSVTLTPSRSVIPIEKVRGCKPAEAGAVESVKAANKLPPLVNARLDGCIEMTKAEFTHKRSYGSAYIKTASATETHGAYRYRTVFNAGGNFTSKPVFITDEKIKDLPTVDARRAAIVKAVKPEPTNAPLAAPRTYEVSETERMARETRAAAKQGVQVVTAPDLFPTPVDLADRMAQEANIRPRADGTGIKVLEPSAGTGRLIAAIRENGTGYALTAVEVNAYLARHLEVLKQVDDLHRCDFLEFTTGSYDRIVMNPPFSGGADIAHIEHALTLLAPGGRLVALCAAGPRQRERLAPLGTWEDLPEGSFNEAGTNVRVALLIVDK